MRDSCEKFQPQGFAVFDGHQRACKLLSERCKCFLLYFPKFNKIFPPFSRGRIHELFDLWNNVILRVGFLYFGIFSSLFFFSLLVDPVLIPLHRPRHNKKQPGQSYQAEEFVVANKQICNAILLSFCLSSWVGESFKDTLSMSSPRF